MVCNSLATLEKFKRAFLTRFEGTDEGDGRYLFQCSAIPTFRYSVGVAQWTPADLNTVSLLWVRAYKNANHLMNLVARSLIIFPYERGGLQVQTAYTVALKELGSHLYRCLNYPDTISEQLWEEAGEALDKVLHLSTRAHSNSFTSLAYLARINGVRIEWSSYPVQVKGMSWASVLRPIRYTDVNWSDDEELLRKTALTYHESGFRDRSDRTSQTETSAVAVTSHFGASVRLWGTESSSTQENRAQSN
eukprot:3830159-Rhodomonas_salina.1